MLDGFEENTICKTGEVWTYNSLQPSPDGTSKTISSYLRACGDYLRYYHNGIKLAMYIHLGNSHIYYIVKVA